MSRLLIWPVKGMKSRLHEQRLSDFLKTLPAVEEVEVSLVRERAGIRVCTGARVPSRRVLNAKLQKLGFELLAPTVDQLEKEGAMPATCELPGSSRPFSARIAQALFAFLGVYLSFRLLWPILATRIPTVTAEASLLALLGLGIVASLSTCLASTGAFLLAYSSGRSKKSDLLWLHLGRLLAFVLGGGLLGAIGRLWTVSSASSGIVEFVLGGIFLMVALNLLELTPSLGSFGLSLPRSWSRFVESRAQKHGAIASFIVGAATFILPCGFTQTAQTLALASGSFTRGALLLGAFAFGTLPTLLGVSWFGSLATLKQRSFRLVTGAILFLFALGQVDGGLTVLGAPMTLGGLANRVWINTVAFVVPPTAQAQEQLVKMDVARGMFSPNRFVIHQGVPVRWEVNGVDLGGCASTLLAPTLGIRRDLQFGANTILFTPKQTGEIPFSCSIGAIRGSFTVVP